MAEAWRAPQFNLAGIALFEDDFPYIPTGDYEVVLVETAPWKKKGSQEISSVIFRLRIADGPENGKPVAKWIGLEVNEGNARGWKSAYISHGYDPKGLESVVQPDTTHFKPGTKMYIHMDSPPKAEGQKLKAEDFNCNFLSPQTYQKRKAERAMTGGNGASATGPQSFAPAGAAPGLPSAPATVAQQPTAPVAPQPASGGASLFGAPPQAPQQPQAPAAPAGAPPPPPGMG